MTGVNFKTIEGGVDNIADLKDIVNDFAKRFPKASDKIAKVFKPVLENKGYKKLTKLNYISALKVIVRMYPVIMMTDPSIGMKDYINAMKKTQSSIEATLKIQQKEKEDAIHSWEAKKKADRDDMLAKITPLLKQINERAMDIFRVKSAEELKDVKGLRIVIGNVFSPTSQEIDTRDLRDDEEFFEKIFETLGYRSDMRDVKTILGEDQVVADQIKQIYSLPEVKKLQEVVRDTRENEGLEAIFSMDESNPLFSRTLERLRVVRDPITNEIIKRPDLNLDELLKLYNWDKVVVSSSDNGLTPEQDIRRAERLKDDERRIAEAEEKLKNIRT